MERRSILKLLLFGTAMSQSVGPTTLGGSESANHDVGHSVDTWSAGLRDLTREEYQFLRGLAADREEAIGTRSGLFEPPGKNSEIVRQPIFYDLVADTNVDRDTLDPRLKALVAQRGDRFYYFESGVTINRGRWESIDALIFEMHFSPAQVSTHSQTPDFESKAVLTLGTEVNLALRGNLTLRPIKVTAKPIVAEGSAAAGGHLVLQFEHTFNVLEEVLVSAIGEKQPWCRWMVNPRHLKREDVVFIAVLRIPKETTSLAIHVTATFVDKLFKAIELSRQSKQAVYKCRLEPPTCIFGV